MSSFHPLLKPITERLAAERAWVKYPGGGVRLAAALLYPSPYAVAMSSLGFQQIFRSWNAIPGVGCDRAFLPDDVPAWRRAGLPLTGYETGRPVGGFDVLGISLAYELELPGVIEVIELAGLRALASERRPTDPPVIVGGPLSNSNPLPAYLFADVVVIGEGEGVAEQLLQRCMESVSKAAFLEAVQGLPGVIVPALDGERLGPLARTVDGELPARSAIVTPHTELSDMFLIEPERGCHRPCTYCVMRRPDPGAENLLGGGMRLVSPERVLSLIPEDVKRVGLVGAAVTDHPKIKEIAQAIVATGKGLGISSLRADRLDDGLAAVLREGGYKTLTTAADGASERLRKQIRRGTKAKHLLRAAQLVKDHGFRALKLYIMLGLPGEEDADVDELVQFSLQLRAIAPLSLSIAPFVAKKNTPLDGTPFAGVKRVERRLARLRKGLRGKVEIRPTSARWAWVEYRLAQGGVSDGLKVLQARDAGGRFSHWKEALGPASFRSE